MTKIKGTKRSLIGSIMALVFCCSIFLGTTFAWFTSTATTGVNKVQAGNLEVDLVNKNGVSLVGKSLEFIKAQEGQGQPILWEPGCTYKLPEIYVRNNGNLALKYKIAITGIDNGDAKLLEAIKFTVKDQNGNDKDLSKYVDTLNAKETNETGLVIEATMKTSAGNEYQGLSIEGIAITVYATQAVYESDSNKNDYDKDAKFDNEVTIVSNADQLVKAFDKLKDGDIISLANNIDLENTALKSANNIEFTLYGNGKTISNLSYVSSNDKAGALVSSIGAGKAVMIEDLTLDNAKVEGKTFVGGFVGYADAASSIVIRDCKITNSKITSGDYAGGFIGWNSGYNKDNDGPVHSVYEIIDCSITDSTITGGGSAGGAVGHAGANPRTENYITNFTAIGNKITGEAGRLKTGIVVGTANVGKVVIKTTTLTGNDIPSGSYDPAGAGVYGRFVPVTTGKLFVNGVEVTTATVEKK